MSEYDDAAAPRDEHPELGDPFGATRTESDKPDEESRSYSWRVQSLRGGSNLAGMSVTAVGTVLLFHYS